MADETPMLRAALDGSLSNIGIEPDDRDRLVDAMLAALSTEDRARVEAAIVAARARRRELFRELAADARGRPPDSFTDTR